MANPDHPNQADQAKHPNCTENVPLSTEKVPLSTEKVPQYRGTGTSDLGSRGVHRHPFCRGFKLKKVSSTEKVPQKYRKSTTKVPQKYCKSTAVPVPVTGLGPGVSIDTHIVGALSLKKRKNEKKGF